MKTWDFFFSPPTTKRILVFSHESENLSGSPHYTHIICSITKDLSSDVDTFGICPPFHSHPQENVMNCWSSALCRCTALLITAEGLQRSAQLRAAVSAWRRWRRWALSSSYVCPDGLILCTEAICRHFKPKLSENEEVPRASRMGHGSVTDFPLLFFTETVKHKDWSHHSRLQHRHMQTSQTLSLESWVVGF